MHDIFSKHASIGYRAKTGPLETLKILERASSTLCVGHSKWDLVGYNGASASPGLENAVKRWAGRLGQFVFLFTSMQARSFSPTSEFMGSSIEAKCEPVKMYQQAHEKCEQGHDIPHLE